MSTLGELKPRIDFEWVRIPQGLARVGTTLEEVDEVNEFWKHDLFDPRYEDTFREFLLKEYPQFLIELPAYEISDVPVTNALYRQYVEDIGARMPESLTNEELGGDGSHPVWDVSFDEAQQFCLWLGEKLSYGIRLPSEPEWERAARGDTSRQFPWGNHWDPTLTNTLESQLHKPTAVRSYPEGRSIFGLYDMAGNVEEWTTTGYDVYPGGKVIIDDLYELLGSGYKVLKGGFFGRKGDLCRVARRHGRHPSEDFRFTGFRVVKNR